MKRRLGLAWRHHPWLSLAFVAAIMLASFFLIRTVWVTIYWSQPEHQKQELQAWMTPRYVLHSWDLEREDVEHLLEENKMYKGMTLGKIAEQKGLSFEEFAEQMQAEIMKTQKASHE